MKMIGSYSHVYFNAKWIFVFFSTSLMKQNMQKIRIWTLLQFFHFSQSDVELIQSTFKTFSRPFLVCSCSKTIQTPWIQLHVQQKMHGRLQAHVTDSAGPCSTTLKC